jgi:hypothetical protein
MNLISEVYKATKILIGRRGKVKNEKECVIRDGNFIGSRLFLIFFSELQKTT